MLVHSVYFWLRDDLSADQLAAFRQGVQSLCSIKAAEAVYVGQPAGTDRPIIDRSYSFGLTVVCKDQAAHDAYQMHPVHKEFAKTFATFWKKIVIFDAE